MSVLKTEALTRAIKQYVETLTNFTINIHTQWVLYLVTLQTMGLRFKTHVPFCIITELIFITEYLAVDTRFYRLVELVKKAGLADSINNVFFLFERPSFKQKVKIYT